MMAWPKKAKSSPFGQKMLQPRTLLSVKQSLYDPAMTNI